MIFEIFPQKKVGRKNMWLFAVFSSETTTATLGFALQQRIGYAYVD